MSGAALAFVANRRPLPPEAYHELDHDLARTECDVCAIVSIMAYEETAAVYEKELAGARAPWTAALAAWEAIIVLSRPDQLACRYIRPRSNG